MKMPNFCALVLALFALTTLTMLSACVKPLPVKFRVGSEPEGAYVLYRVEASTLPCKDRWIYLGNTPYQGILSFDRSALQTSGRVALRLMRPGYMDQTREWTGAAFVDEMVRKNVIFWVPEMVPGEER